MAEPAKKLCQERQGKERAIIQAPVNESIFELWHELSEAEDCEMDAVLALLLLD